MWCPVVVMDSRLGRNSQVTAEMRKSEYGNDSSESRMTDVEPARILGSCLTLDPMSGSKSVGRNSFDV
jgi:hypothetical protein